MKLSPQESESVLLKIEKHTQEICEASKVISDSMEKLAHAAQEVNEEPVYSCSSTTYEETDNPNIRVGDIYEKDGKNFIVVAISRGLPEIEAKFRLKLERLNNLKKPEGYREG